MIRFIEHNEPGYALRTVANARAADLTIAFAVDFKTPGEILTRKAAYGKYVAIEMWRLWEDELRFDNTPYHRVDEKIHHSKTKCLNIAGNGIYTLKDKNIDQSTCDDMVFNFLSEIVSTYPNITSIRSGGQTGVDEAALKAGDKLGLDCTCLAPKNWLFRDINGKDHMHDPDAFCARFGPAYTNDI